MKTTSKFLLGLLLSIMVVLTTNIAVFAQTCECDGDVPRMGTINWPGTNLEGKYYYTITKDTVYRPLHCGANPTIPVDPCNPWILTFRVAIWEEDIDCVYLDSITFNWDTLLCQDLRWKVVEPVNYVPGNPYKRIVVEFTMIPHEREDYLCRDTATIYQCLFPDGKWVYPSCWLDCLGEQLVVYGRDACPIPNIVMCRIEWDKPLPAELETFTYSVSGNNVALNWRTLKETNNSGFAVERSSNGEWTQLDFVKGAGNSLTPTDYIFVDRNVSSGVYNYRLKQIDYNGTFQYAELEGVVAVGVPDKFTLSQNFPNPFNPTTTVVFGLPESGPVTLKIYDNSGRQVATLLNEIKEAGYYTVTFSVPELASGMYFYKLESGNFVAAKKMVLIK